MKFQIAGAILVAIVILVGFSAASDSGYTTIEGNIQDVFSLTVDPARLQLNLIPGSTLYVDGNLIVTANGPWKVTAKSDHPQGKMSQYNSVDGYFRFHPWQYKELYNSLAVSSPPNQICIQLTDQDQTLIPTNNDYGNNMVEHIQYIQTTNTEYDKRIGPSDVYRIVVTFTGSMTY